VKPIRRDAQHVAWGQKNLKRSRGRGGEEILEGKNVGGVQVELSLGQNKNILIQNTAACEFIVDWAGKNNDILQQENNLMNIP
jgi:hypothetical protein